VFQSDEILFYQMNGFVLATWLASALQEDSRMSRKTPGACSLAHNVAQRNCVEPLMEQLVAAGGRLMRPADAPPHGGLRGYVADPDGHTWEIAWNPSRTIDAVGHVTFGI
jgi:uncharacterized protein